MYTEELPKSLFSTTLVHIKYDCCGKEHILKWKDADKNFKKNGGKHVCRPCWLKSDNPAKKQSSKDKAKQTNLKRYGTTMPMNQEHLIEERRQKFNNEEFLTQWNEKRKQTCLEKYGVEHQTQSEEVKEKQKQTMLENWGVENAMQSEEIREKVKKTNLERYGVENPAQSPEIREKMYKTTEERFGTKHYNELPEMREYMREHCKEWLAESWANPWAKGIKRPEEWNQKQRESVRKLITSGNWMGGYVSNFKGHFPATKCKKYMPRFLSILEAKYHMFLNLNDQVEWYDYEGLVIPYTKLDGSCHDYYVDFLVKYYDDESLHAFEIKAWKNREREEVVIKYEAGYNYCQSKGYTYQMLFESDINLLGISDEQIKSLPGLKIWEKEGTK